jgi:hypothetical protein
VGTGTKLVGAGLVLVLVLFQALWLGFAAVLLSVALVVAFGVWVGTHWRVERRLRPVLALALPAFLVHLLEEYLTGFHRAMPALYGRPGWTGAEFLTFNGVWALVFAASALAARPGRGLPVLFALFFAIAGGLGNFVVHTALVIERGGYFPGAYTAPLCLIVGLWLLRVLYKGESG